MTSMFSWQKTLLAFALLHFVLQGQTSLYFRYLLTSSFCILVPYDEKDIFFLVLFLEGVVGLIELVNVALVDGALTWITVTLNGLPWE